MFKGMVKRCADCGFDLAGGRVEVVPTAHYMMGGISFDLDTSTALPGLFCAGEDSGGVHGANRLGGNGVANSTVFGGIAGEEMARFAASEAGWQEADLEVAAAAAAASLRPFALRAGDLNGLRRRLLDMMWDEAGIIRTSASLGRALRALEGFEAELLATGIPDSPPAFNLTWHDWLNLESQIAIAKAICHAALARENSRGAHWRDDFPDEGDLAASCFTQVTRAGDGTFAVTTQPVRFTIVKPGESLIEGDIGAPAAAG